MDEKKFAADFEQHREHLRAVAYRMLGSAAEAEDAIQETWIKASRADVDAVDNLGGWLTTIIGRVCLDALRSRSSKREDSLDAQPIERAAPDNPEADAVLADSVGQAMIVVLDALKPAERLAFVLHDMFAVPFDEIAPIVERTPEATQRMASRARARVKGTSPLPAVDLSRQKKVVNAFLSAARAGRFEDLLTILDPDVVFRADAVVATFGGSPEVRGAAAVAELYNGRAQAARFVLLDGNPGVVVAPYGRVLVVLELSIVGDRISEVRAVADPRRLAELELALGED
ncbi:MAG TPA: sigma-70 family RNA polymerase sigma factor [Stackebrandtia sp.]|uniref:sigma-70 family RNA polymerase sigma factor n=1 Tax=Stackebrandtia sp. TaxID=2023065 RepID=UPI002D580F3C|nr:sigma-70 family RNA polymerase sigma factor [Stackebrandtia sp.]HZE40347.1 sigma-70 family RNA polymerase sigma factor [Stackebrandtia sp.]